MKKTDWNSERRMRSGLCLKVLSVVALVAASMGSYTAVAQSFSSSAVESSATTEPMAGAGAAAAQENAFQDGADRLPFEYGVIAQGGVGLTEERGGFKFLMAGVQAGKVLYSHPGGRLGGNFEYAGELFPYWQSFTPKFQRANCVQGAEPDEIDCSPLYTVGGTFTGVTVTPIILRWNFTTGRRLVPWAQAAGGLLWTNHKYPAFGSGVLNLTNDGPNTDASVFNFTPQGGIGLHYFITPQRSIDFGANAVHISSASLGDKNPGVNASVQFNLGYTFWK